MSSDMSSHLLKYQNMHIGWTGFNRKSPAFFLKPNYVSSSLRLSLCKLGQLERSNQSAEVHVHREGEVKNSSNQKKFYITK